MNEDRFNMDIRKFLKVVGVTSQREIETAVRDALAKGRLKESALLKPRVNPVDPRARGRARRRWRNRNDLVRQVGLRSMIT